MTMKTITENHNQTKCRIVDPSPNKCNYNTTPAPKAQGIIVEEEERFYESEEQGLCLLEMLEAIYPGSLTDMST